MVTLSLYIYIYIFFFAAQMTEESVMHTRIHAKATHAADPVQTGETPASQEHLSGYLLIVWHASLARVHWPRDATHLGTMCANTRSSNGMPS